eukprot:CAMPEP_0119405034 /NCGR_PEP_ID=MMETSP1334-20130426/144193_1 /TAXON_ID=127549 /ORGANISM="Calcidiscus leptoporus, Strain RCC1130" /LENGTH=181 /DNA_ID=CAMNT_0007429005 /DNA_START=311 /DNA_END=857 /DNA_ORIENTATION=+
MALSEIALWANPENEMLLSSPPEEAVASDASQGGNADCLAQPADGKRAAGLPALHSPPVHSPQGSRGLKPTPHRHARDDSSTLPTPPPSGEAAAAAAAAATAAAGIDAAAVGIGVLAGLAAAAPLEPASLVRRRRRAAVQAAAARAGGTRADPAHQHRTSQACTSRASAPSRSALHSGEAG